MNHPVTLAMRYYSSSIERIFSTDGLESGLMLGIFGTVLLVPLVNRQRSPDTPYFSGSFALALCPFLFAAVIVLLRLHSILESEDPASSYVLERLRVPRQLLFFGGALSLFSLIIHSVIHAARRKTAPATSECPESAVR